MNTAIIVAAGSGKRFGGEIPKQFLKIKEKPVLIHTLDRFQECEIIDDIVLVLSSEMIQKFADDEEKYDITKLRTKVIGGKTRAESVFNGLLAIDKQNADVIAVHDGARPLVSSSEITRTVRMAKEIGSACLVAEVTDTIKEIKDGKIVKTIDRTRLRRALTPQCFRYEIIYRAYTENDLDGVATDECFLVEKLGYEIAEVLGSSKNIKITHEEDLLIAESFL